MQRVALASTDLAAHVHDGVSHSAAHKFLTHMRDTHGATMWQQDLHDLTDSNEFNMEELPRQPSGDPGPPP